MDLPAHSLEELISARRIGERIAELGHAITRDYAGKELMLVAVLKGSFVFAADLSRAIDLPQSIQFLGLKSYGDGQESSGVVQITSDFTQPITGRHVLVVEDIVDTGLTMNYLMRNFATRGPASIGLCSFLHKPARARIPTKIDYLGFSIEDVFVVGYGLDWGERYRNLPYLAKVVPGGEKSGDK